ncbi:MAG: hypothetical protein V7K57_10980 [Nostoc sp.]|uniref:hypothetical protein n=1 Tax=Nostoc sp. TaxID=1180 RepID=UPI002FF6DF18
MDPTFGRCDRKCCIFENDLNAVEEEFRSQNGLNLSYPLTGVRMQDALYKTLHVACLRAGVRGLALSEAMPLAFA